MGYPSSYAPARNFLIGNSTALYSASPNSAMARQRLSLTRASPDLAIPVRHSTWPSYTIAIRRAACCTIPYPGLAAETRLRHYPAEGHGAELGYTVPSQNSSLVGARSTSPLPSSTRLCQRDTRRYYAIQHLAVTRPNSTLPVPVSAQLCHRGAGRRKSGPCQCATY